MEGKAIMADDLRTSPKWRVYKQGDMQRRASEPRTYELVVRIIPVSSVT
jgi:hypothetical protein